VNVDNDHYVNKGVTVNFKGQHFPPGHRFPAADLGIDQKSFDSLIRDKSIVSGKERNEFVHPEEPEEPKEPKELEEPSDDLEDMTKAELIEFAESFGLELDGSMKKDELIAAIKEAGG